MTAVLWVLALLAFAAGCWFAGAVAKGLTKSLLLGVLAGVSAAVLGAAHALHGFVRAVGEYEGEPTGYERLVDEQWFPLLVAYMAGPALLLVAGHAVWQLVSRRR